MSQRPPAAFDLVARVLANRLDGTAASPELRSLLASRTLDGEGVVELASEHFVLAGLAAAIVDLGADRDLDPSLRDFLAFVHAANTRRNHGLLEQLGAVVAALNQVGIEPVLLKGAIRLVDHLYPDPGWRMMRDLDLLVPEAAVVDAVRALERAGYAVTKPPADPEAKDVKLRRPGAAPVEIHRDLVGRPWTSPTCAQGLVARSRPVEIGGAIARLPSVEDQLGHLISHGQLGHFNAIYGRISLRDRMEAAALLRRAGEDVDLEALGAGFAAAGHRWILESFLLSLRDGGLWTGAAPDRHHVLVGLQCRRIRWQARSHLLRRLSLGIGWCIVLMKLQLSPGRDGRPRFVPTATDLIRDRRRRQRIVRTLVQGAPSVW